MHKIYVNNKEITPICGGLEWSSNVDTLGLQLSFDVAYYEGKEYVKPGDIILVRENQTTIFVGEAIAVDFQGRISRKVTCFDFAFILNKSEMVIQIKNQTVSSAIQELCKRFNIKSNIVSIPLKVKKIYKDEKVSDIIKDLLEQASKKTGVKYRMEMRSSTLFIEKQTNLVVKVATDYIMNPQRSLSVENMINSVVVVSDKSDVVKVSATASSSTNIKKYGLLQMVETSDAKNKAQAQNLANQLLKQFNKVAETGSVELLGNANVRAGRILKLVEPVTGFNGHYLITSARHTSSGGIYTMQLNLEVI